MRDLKQDELLWWMKNMRLFSSVDVERYGLQNYFTSAIVRAREFARLGLIEKVSKEECLRRGLNMGKSVQIRWWEYKKGTGE